MHDPNYDLKEDYALKPNAYVEPNNPKAVFPQHPKPHILDFRAYKMPGAGFAGRFNFRKLNNPKAIQSKYVSVVKTRAELDAEEKQQELDQELEEERQKQAELDQEDEEDFSAIKKAYTVDDITMGMDSQLKLTKKKKKSKTADAEMMEATKTIKKEVKNSKISLIKQKSKCKRTRKQLKF